MNSIIMNFDEGVDINAVYNHLKKIYPKSTIVKKVENEELKARKELQEAMEKQFIELGINSEEEFIDWIESAREEIWRESHESTV